MQIFEVLLRQKTSSTTTSCMNVVCVHMCSSQTVHRQRLHYNFLVCSSLSGKDCEMVHPQVCSNPQSTLGAQTTCLPHPCCHHCTCSPRSHLCLSKISYMIHLTAMTYHSHDIFYTWRLKHAPLCSHSHLQTLHTGVISQLRNHCS